MPKGYEPEIKESERQSYLEREARKYSKLYGINEKQMREVLCAVWEWDPKRYLSGDRID